MALTADDAREVADRLLGAAEAIDTYLDDKHGTIERSDYDAMSRSARFLLRASSSVTTDAVGLSIDQMQDDAAELKQVIVDAKESLAKLQTVRKAIRVAAGLADLATAIVARNPGGVFKAAKDLYGLADEAEV